MPIPFLHMPTLFGVTALVIAFSGLLLLLARSSDDASGVAALWGGAILTGAGGLVLLALGAALPAFLTHDVAHALLLLGVATSWTAARRFSGRAPMPWIVLAGAGAWLALCRVPDDALPPPPRIALICAMAAGYTLAAAAELWSTRTERLPSCTPALALLLLHAGVYVARAAAVLAMPWSAGGEPSQIVGAALLIEGLLHTVATAFVLLALLKERAERRSTAQLRQFALFDGLTGLSNRRHFDQTLDREFQRALRGASSLSLLLIDIDHFKAFNDCYGHQGGDECLRAVAVAINGALHRPADLAARYGGEEIAVLLPGTDEPGAVALAHDVRRAVRALGVEHAGSPLGRLAISIGVAALVPGRPPADPGLLVRAADQALYAAKSAGRDAVRSAGQLAGPDPAPCWPRLVHPAGPSSGPSPGSRSG